MNRGTPGDLHQLGEPKKRLEQTSKINGDVVYFLLNTQSVLLPHLGGLRWMSSISPKGPLPDCWP